VKLERSGIQHRRRAQEGRRATATVRDRFQGDCARGAARRAAIDAAESRRRGVASAPTVV